MSARDGLQQGLLFCSSSEEGEATVSDQQNAGLDSLLIFVNPSCLSGNPRTGPASESNL